MSPVNPGESEGLREWHMLSADLVTPLNICVTLVASPL